MTVLALTGSTGHIGGRVARLLGPAVSRLIVRDPARAPRIDGDPQVVAADYDDRDAARAALDGVDVLLMVSAGESEHRRTAHRRFITAAADAGVRHVVYTSFDGAAPDAVFTLGRDHWDAEQALRDSGMAWTFLRDNLYSDFFPLFADEQGVIRGPAGDGRVAGVARADVGDVAAAVLAAPEGHEGAVYTLTGPEAFSFAEAAERMTAALGRRFRFEDQTLAEAYESRRVFTDAQWQLDAWVSTYTAAAEGALDRVTDDVERLTGRPARTLEQALEASA
ncbi:SDR family oxidoreductase [Amnibacterium sp. CER49]|uniref:SDR family oxidoreductase n=1 Tax=Amnibacterium sp. CER49 TaxID=3039161 RepID=UPI00244A71BF|nr:SDR family oxidoreductase [Amnibacterium sp. CER49]MDH2444476.1 SDR family oxidoreductase [Amnibacterium sp. CER49]